MEEGNITRRRLLATVGTAGGTGAVFGTGTTALLSDDETLSDSVLESGSVDLRVDWTVDGGAGGSSEGNASIDVELTDENRTGSTTFAVRLPDELGNNPAYGWLRLSCPEPSRLVEALDVELAYDCGSTTTSIASGSLGAVANELRNGIPLDPDCVGAELGEQDCLRPGDPIDLVLSWTLDDDFRGKADTSLDLAFVGSQCRHTDGTLNPFRDAHPAPCEGPSGKDVSWVGFCAEDGETLDPGDLDFDVDGDTLTVHAAPPSLATIVLKYGTEMRVFTDPGTSGTYRTDDVDGTTYDQDGSGFEGTARTNKEPCPGTCGLKYESDDDFQEPTSNGCSA